VSQRRCWKDYILKHPTRLLEHAIEAHDETALYEYFNIDASRAEKLRVRLEEKGFTNGNFVHKIPAEMMAAAETLITRYAFSPSKMSPRLVSKSVKNYLTSDEEKAVVLEKDSFDWLVSMGFRLPVDKNILVPVERNEIEKLEAIAFG